MVTLLDNEMGTTNGIEVSPNGKTLYVNESVQRNMWAFDLGGDGSLTNKRLLKRFDDHGLDGMRCDVAGNLYVTRHGKGTVVILSPRERYCARWTCWGRSRVIFASGARMGARYT
jgi:sugar lactone lactonase YvrE